MKILYITYIPSPYRVAFFECLGKTVELTVLFECAAEPGRDVSWNSNSFCGFNAEFLNNKVADQSKFDKSAVKYLEENAGKFDVIVVTNAISKTGALVTKYLRNKNIDYWIEGDGAFLPENENPIKKMIKKQLLKGAKGYIATCKNHIDYYVNYGVKKDKIYKCSFSSVWEKDIVKAPATKEEKEILRQRLGIIENKVIVYAGQFIHRKGLDILKEAMKYVDSDVGLYLIGGKDDTIKNSNIHVIDFLLPEKLKDYYRAADCFVLPTREDIWGLVVNEAMSQGLPVVTTDKCNAGLEMIENCATGSIVKSEDFVTLASEINEIINLTEEEWTKKSNLCIEKAETQTIEKMVESRLKVFEIN